MELDTGAESTVEEPSVEELTIETDVSVSELDVVGEDVSTGLSTDWLKDTGAEGPEQP
ncbi:MAG TPA: hypothetical protein VHV10_00850 [Ktedonobacteraceae bacterium]|nr:hypothetical protein [Ktedonobacteraceae bacterium]